MSPIKAFDYVNSTIQSVTGYSFSLSNLSKNISKVAPLTIALVTGMYIATSAEGLSESYLIECCCNYDDCVARCAEDAFHYEDYFHTLGKCVRVCVRYFP